MNREMVTSNQALSTRESWKHSDDSVSSFLRTGDRETTKNSCGRSVVYVESATALCIAVFESLAKRFCRVLARGYPRRAMKFGRENA